MILLPRLSGWIALLLCLAWLWGGAAGTARAVDFPGPDPQQAKAQADDTSLVLENRVLACRWTLDGGHLRPDRVTDKLSGKTLALGGECFAFLVARSPSPEAQVVKASELKLAGAPRMVEVKADPQSRRLADRFAGREIAVAMATPDGKVAVQWRAVLRDGANYVRQHVQIRAKAEPVELRDLVLLELSAPGAEVAGSVDGSPVVAGNFFLAYEHPMSRSTVQPADGEGATVAFRSAKEAGSGSEKKRNFRGAKGDCGVVRCGYPYSVAVMPEAPVEHTLAIGVVPEGQLRRGFLYYLERERTQPYRTFLH